MFNGKSYARRGPFGKCSLRPMHDLVYYLRYIPCVEIVDVPSRLKSCNQLSRGSYGGEKPTHGTRSPVWAFEILQFRNLNIIKLIVFRPQRIHLYHYCGGG